MNLKTRYENWVKEGNPDISAEEMDQMVPKTSSIETAAEDTTAEEADLVLSHQDLPFQHLTLTRQKCLHIIFYKKLRI